MENSICIPLNNEGLEVIKEFQSVKGLSDDELLLELQKALITAVKSKITVKQKSILGNTIKDRVLKAVSGEKFTTTATIPGGSLGIRGENNKVELSDEYKKYVIDKCLPIAVCQMAVGRQSEGYILNSINGSLRLKDAVWYEFRRLVARARKYRGCRIEYNDSFRSAEDAITEVLKCAPFGIDCINVRVSAFKEGSYNRSYGDSVVVREKTMWVFIALEQHLL